MNQLITSVGDFYEEFQYGQEAWWLPFVILIAMYALFVIINRFDRKRFPLAKPHYILRNVIVVAAVAAFLLIAFYCFLWSSSTYYSKHGTELIHLVTLGAVLLVAIIALLGWRKKFERERLKEVVEQPLTQKEERRFFFLAYKSFNKSKLWLLFPALGFIMLVAFLYRPYSLVSFILDNSSSMAGHIEQGRDSLIRTIQELDGNTEIIIGWLTEDKPPKASIEEITAVTETSLLLGQHGFFTNKKQAQDYLLGDIPVNGGTPLYEAIWSNFLFAKTQTRNRNYSRRLLVIVTDGGDNLAGEKLERFLCTREDFAEFFPEVACVNLGGEDTNNFFQKARDCNYLIEDGSDKETYSIALDTILHNYKNNWSFIIWLAIIYVVLSMIAVAIQPRRA